MKCWNFRFASWLCLKQVVYQQKQYIDFYRYQNKRKQGQFKNSHNIFHERNIWSATFLSDFFIVDGIYKFDPEMVAENGVVFN